MRNDAVDKLNLNPFARILAERADRQATTFEPPKPEEAFEAGALGALALAFEIREMRKAVEETTRALQRLARSLERSERR